jgi:hypothetical protein
MPHSNSVILNQKMCLELKVYMTLIVMKQEILEILKNLLYLNLINIVENIHIGQSYKRTKIALGKKKIIQDDVDGVGIGTEYQYLVYHQNL